MQGVARATRQILALATLLVAAIGWEVRADEPAAPAAASSNPPTSGPNSLTPDEQSAGWLLLFDGESLFGWQPTSEADWKIADGVISVSSGEKGLLATTNQWADYRFKADFRAPASTNSGIFLRTPLVPSDPAKDCYELNIAGPQVSPFFTGSFVGRQKAEAVELSDDWHTFDVTLEAGRCTVKIDDRQVLDYTDPAPLGRGHIGLQLNSGPVEFRNIKLLPLGLKPLFNGRDLEGWTVYPDKPSKFTVTPEGELQLSKGPGQLETTGQYADFCLQLDIRTAARGLNSGVFFRSIPGGWWQGYEAQISNTYRRGDRAQPIDFGSGGIYRRQPARRVVANDMEWFRMTVVAVGNHLATWVNGYPVCDWTDERPPSDNPREGLRLAPGTISLQGHDPTTNLLFRRLEIAELPTR
ncbi:MAG: DUF1080 domain-containing protein [Pirellulales bacterium]|nr:DUF1080 domain-containing protein [Pirellulales bacterium]